MSHSFSFQGVVAIDGPAGSGKSTVSKALATTLGAGYLDTGAMYRAATLAVLNAGVDPADTGAVIATVAGAKLEFGTTPDNPYTRVDGQPADTDIREPNVTGAVSAVAGIPAVRKQLIAEQRNIIAATASNHSIVVEGRDIAAVVAPDADLKIYLTAHHVERARRRSAENGADITATAGDLTRRDTADSAATKPLEAAPGAEIIDTTDLTIDEVVTALLDLLKQRGAV